MYYYSAYGLDISSDLELPELRPSDRAESDLTIRLDRLGGPAEGEVYGSEAFHTRVPGVGLFYLREGRELIVDPDADAVPEELRTTILGPILSALLRQRRINVLHASSVVIRGHAVAFIGPQSAGKSTMAHACYAAGHAVMADDVTGIVRREDGYHVLPGYSQIKLRNETAEALFEDGDALPWLLPSGGKRVATADERFPTRSYPLASIYALRISDRMDISPVATRDALFYLLRNSRGIPPLEAPQFLQIQLQQCTDLAASVSVSVLRRMPNLGLIGDVVGLVERDLAGTGTDGEGLPGKRAIVQATS